MFRQKNLNLAPNIRSNMADRCGKLVVFVCCFSVYFQFDDSSNSAQMNYNDDSNSNISLSIEDGGKHSGVPASSSTNNPTSATQETVCT